MFVFDFYTITGQMTISYHQKSMLAGVGNRFEMNPPSHPVSLVTCAVRRPALWGAWAWSLPERNSVTLESKPVAWTAVFVPLSCLAVAARNFCITEGWL